MPEEHARVSFNAGIEVWVTPSDLEDLLDYQQMVQSGASREDLLREAASEKLSKAEAATGGTVDITAEQATIDSDTINWEAILHPASETDLPIEDMFDPSDARARPPKEKFGSRKRAANPAQSASNDVFKIVKKLQDLLNELAKLQDREAIAQVAGLTELPTSIDRLYEYADKLRAGGVQPVGGPPPAEGVPQGQMPDKQQEQVAAAGFDPDKLRALSKVFMDDRKPVEDPAEKYRFERERASSPHGVDSPAESESH